MSIIFRSGLAVGITAALLAVTPSVAAASVVGPLSQPPAPNYAYGGFYQTVAECLYWVDVSVNQNHAEFATCIVNDAPYLVDMWFIPEGASEPGGPL